MRNSGGQAGEHSSHKDLNLVKFGRRGEGFRKNHMSILSYPYRKLCPNRQLSQGRLRRRYQRWWCKSWLNLNKKATFAVACIIKWKVSWQCPTLPGGCPPSTIGADELNCRVRDVTGCTLIARITKRHISMLIRLNNICSNEYCIKKSSEFSASRWSPRSLVQFSSTHCCAYTYCLSSRWSTCDLTILTIKVI